jgi:hypothetical protein
MYFMRAVVAVGEWLWRLECSLNKRFPKPGRAALPAEYVRCGRSLPLLEVASGASSPPPHLLVVITTHARPLSCARCIEDLAREAKAASLNPLLLVLEDPSAADYGPVTAALEQHFPDRYAHYRGARWLGKRGYWRVFQRAFDAVRLVRPELTLFLQDDLSLRSGFFSELLELWSALADSRKAVLYACSMEGDEQDGRWIRYKRRSRANGRLWRTQWFDLQAFLAGPRFFELLGDAVFPISDARWKRDPTRSSGVGEQFSRRLLRRGGIYQVKRTLVFHGGETSLMNPEGRARIRFDNREPAPEAGSASSSRP